MNEPATAHELKDLHAIFKWLNVMVPYLAWSLQETLIFLRLMLIYWLGQDNLGPPEKIAYLH